MRHRYKREYRFQFKKKDKDDLYRMVTLRKKRSGLPVNIHLDDSLEYKTGGHNRRIKFQPDKGDHPVTYKYIPMTISDEPLIPFFKRRAKDIKISKEEIDMIKNFVRKNKRALEELSDMKIEFDEFLQRMVK